MSSYDLIQQIVREASEKVVIERDSLILAYLKDHPATRVEDIRFCQQQVWEDDKLVFKYWVEVVDRHRPMVEDAEQDWY